MLNNKMVGAHINNIDLNKHIRAAQEGIAFAFRYGLDIMRSNGMQSAIIRAGKANMFLSNIFCESFVNATNVPVELYNCDRSVGAALGAGIDAGYFKNPSDAFIHTKKLQVITSTQTALYDDLYEQWKAKLEKQLSD